MLACVCRIVLVSSLTFSLVFCHAAFCPVSFCRHSIHSLFMYKIAFTLPFDTSKLSRLGSVIFRCDYIGGWTSAEVVKRNGMSFTWEQSRSAVSFTLPPIFIDLVNLSNLIALFERKLIILSSVITFHQCNSAFSRKDRPTRIEQPYVPRRRQTQGLQKA